MADGKKKNTRTVVALGGVLLLVLFFTLPIDGRTGYQRSLDLFSSAPASAPPKTTVIPPIRGGGYQTELVTEGRPAVDDDAHRAQPLDDLTSKDKEALEKLIQDVQKKR